MSPCLFMSYFKGDPVNLSAMVYHYQELLNPLIKWKILDTESLRVLSGYRGRYDSFCEMLRGLKAKGLIHWESFLHRQPKIVYLTKEVHEEIFPKSSYSLEGRTVFHETIVSIVARSLLQTKYFDDCEFSRNFSTRRERHSYILEPDAVLFRKHKNCHLKIALELELTQNSKERIAEKFDSYIRSEDYHCATYVLNQRSVFDDYKNSVEKIHAAASNRHYKKAIEQKFFLLFKEDLLKFPLDFSEDPFFSINRERKFGEILKG